MAGEPETLHVHEPLQQRIERHDYDRLLMLSDGVFAIAITLLALDLQLPQHWDGSWEGLMGVTGRPLVGYLFGFGLVGAFWFMHRRLFARLEQVDRIITVLNLLLLGLVGLTPFIARMVAEAGPTRALPFYFVAVASVLGSIALMRGWAVVRPGLLHAEVDRRKWRIEVVLVSVGAIGLAAVGGLAIAEHRPVGTNFVLVLMILVAAGRIVTRGSRPQMSSVSRP
jgi:uncharacterized membrane protein